MSMGLFEVFDLEDMIPLSEIVEFHYDVEMVSFFSHNLNYRPTLTLWLQTDDNEVLERYKNLSIICERTGSFEKYVAVHLIDWEMTFNREICEQKLVFLTEDFNN